MQMYNNLNSFYNKWENEINERRNNYKLPVCCSNIPHKIIHDQHTLNTTINEYNMVSKKNYYWVLKNCGALIRNDKYGFTDYNDINYKLNIFCDPLSVLINIIWEYTGPICNDISYCKDININCLHCNKPLIRKITGMDVDMINTLTGIIRFNIVRYTNNNYNF